MNRAITLLNQAIVEGYCLHGSRTMRLEVVEPRQATCRTQEKANCQLAVYAHPHQIRVPLLHAVMQRKCPGKFHLSYSADGDEPLVVGGKNLTIGYGSVYILPPDTFEFFGYEFISYDAVRPCEEIVVGPGTLQAVMHEYDFRIPLL